LYLPTDRQTDRQTDRFSFSPHCTSLAKRGTDRLRLVRRLRGRWDCDCASGRECVCWLQKLRRTDLRRRVGLSCWYPPTLSFSVGPHHDTAHALLRPGREHREHAPVVSPPFIGPVPRSGRHSSLPTHLPFSRPVVGQRSLLRELDLLHKHTAHNGQKGRQTYHPHPPLGSSRSRQELSRITGKVTVLLAMSCIQTNRPSPSSPPRRTLLCTTHPSLSQADATIRSRRTQAGLTSHNPNLNRQLFLWNRPKSPTPTPLERTRHQRHNAAPARHPASYPALPRKPGIPRRRRRRRHTHNLHPNQNHPNSRSKRKQLPSKNKQRRRTQPTSSS